MHTTTTLYTFATRRLDGQPRKVPAGAACEIVASYVTDYGCTVVDLRIAGRYTRCAIHLIQGAA
jgi:hypothetical protein